MNGASMLPWLWLATRSVSDHSRNVLLERFGDAEGVYEGAEKSFSKIPRLRDGGIDSLMDKDLSQCQEILRRCDDLGIELLTREDPRFPGRLAQLSDAPVVLYYKGNLPKVDELPVIAVVGTRKASLYGIQTARRMGYQIAACGGTVVSGVAAGIDAAAMVGALTQGATVLGVLGCGLDVVYPRSNRELYESVIRGGCLISEFPPGTPPRGWNFPRRNRIMSGLSCGVLVVEAPEKSGALITARLALDQGRDVFVVPSNVDVESGAGSNGLLREGALAVCSGWDVMQEYRQRFADLVRPGDQRVPADQPKPEPAAQAKPKASPEKFTKKSIDNRPVAPYSDFKKTQRALPEDQAQVVAQLAQGELLVDELIARTGLETGKVLSALTLLEIQGVVRRLPGRMVSLTGK